MARRARVLVPDACTVIMSQRSLRDPQAFERANYIKILHGYRQPVAAASAPQDPARSIAV